MKAIIYTTNTGTTAQYAKMLAEQTELPAFSMEEASCNSSFHIAGKFRCEKTARNLPPYDEPDGKNDNKKTWSKNRPHTAGK